MHLSIASLSTYVPASQAHSSLLGSVVHSAYGHLFEPAGAHSRPPTVRRGVTIIPTAAYDAPTAAPDERTADLASRVVGQMMSQVPAAEPDVRAIIHTQCTLDQQILGSVCLRIEHDHVAHAESAITIGQLGTAGLPSAFRLAGLCVPETGFACLSACDKWISPFFRSIPGSAVFGDAAGACLVGAENVVAQPVAVVEEVVTSCRPAMYDIWTAPASEQSTYLLDHAKECVLQVLRRRPDVDRDGVILAGDSYGRPFLSRLCEATGIERTLPEVPGPHVHHSSASALIALQHAIAFTVREGRQVPFIVWTASIAGHAGALLVRCNPTAAPVAGGWTSAALVQSAHIASTKRSPQAPRTGQ